MEPSCWLAAAPLDGRPRDDRGNRRPVSRPPDVINGRMESPVAEHRLDRSRECALKPVASSYSRGTTRPGGGWGARMPQPLTYESHYRPLLLFRLRDVGQRTADLVGE